MNTEVTAGKEPFGFLVGAERSGTTLLRLMLDHHPKLAWLNEFEYAVDWVGPDGAWPDLSSYREWLATHRTFQQTGFEVNASLNYGELVNSFLEQKRWRDGKPHVGATVHRGLDRLLTLWPDARFIHLVRDPRDVARSCIRMGWAGNTYTGVAGWLEAEREWDVLCERLPAAQRCEVAFEQLVAAPQRVLGRICNDLGVDYDDRMLSYVDGSTYGAPDPSSCYQWRTKATREQVQWVEARVGDLLRRRGYEPSGYPEREVTPAVQHRLLRQDRWHKRWFRLRRYGPALYLANAVAERLPARGLHARLKQRRNRIDRRYLKR